MCDWTKFVCGMLIDCAKYLGADGNSCGYREEAREICIAQCGRLTFLALPGASKSMSMAAGVVAEVVIGVIYSSNL